MRSCGVLLHISSLPGRGGVGSLGGHARAFVDFLAAAGQSWWQVLPLTPPAEGNSPYSSYSVFAGNPAFVSLETLEQEGLLPFWTQKFMPRHPGERASYDYCQNVHLPLLRQSFKSGYDKHREEVAAFRASNPFWLEDFALFMALRKDQGNIPWLQWPPELRRRDPGALAVARRRLDEEIRFWVWSQYLFFKQWEALHGYAREKGVGLIGDMPLYPAMDSADVWSNPKVFQLDDTLCPTHVAGVPPDAFTADGQLWGNPLYDWDNLKADGYRWWLERLGLGASMYDMVRIDHFRGLDEYYAVPAHATTAREGSWRPGPGMDLVCAVRQHVPDCRLIAEDLGIITDSVRQLLAESGLPGMKVLQFAFDPEGESDYLPHRFVQNCVGYTGTHDNDTVVGWLQAASPAERDFAARYLGLSRKEGIHWGVIRGLYATVADTVIVPMQDFLGLGTKARMNIPGNADGQWDWRLDGRALQGRLSLRMRELAELYRRLPSPANSKSNRA